MKIVSWNVNGLRAAVKKNFVDSMMDVDPDIICLQETKAQVEEVEAALSDLKGYHVYANSAEKKGYSSTAILCKDVPEKVIADIDVDQHGLEGRVLTASLKDFYLVTAYVPNSGRGLVRLKYRRQWDQDLLYFLKELEKEKPVILCGDLNVAHQPIDLKNPKSNYNKTAGYTQDEIDGFSKFLDHGFVDVFRQKYPEEIKYTWWSYMFKARAKNVGWRIDYFLASPALLPRIKECTMLTDIMGSDHCPIILEID